MPTQHTIDSVGFVVHQRRHKLKPEFQDLSGNEIRDLKMAGQDVTTEKRIPVFAYTGDTNPKGLDANPVFYDAKILISELTFVAPEHRKDTIHKHGHMHVDDYVKRSDRFNNELVIAGHLSTRYNDAQVKRLVQKTMPGMLDGRMKLWL